MSTLAIALGLAVLFNFIILRIKWNSKDYVNVVIDVIMLLVLNIIFGGSLLGVISATVGSTFISLYLIWKPFIVSTKDIKTFMTDQFNPSKPETLAARLDKIFEYEDDYETTRHNTRSL